MTLRPFCASAALVVSTVLLASFVPAAGQAQTRPSAPESPYGGQVVEEIVARVNDQIISRSDYDRAIKELDQEARQHGASMQEIAAAHKDMLRNLIDQQLWLSKGKQLGITGDTELVTRLNEIRKQYNLETLEDLEKAARQQGVSYEDFKANIRNGIITQEVMRQTVGQKIRYTPGEVQRFYEEHKKDYAKPESVTLAEILVSTGTPVPSATQKGATEPDDPAKVAAARQKADEIEAKLKAGGDFAQLARTFSDGPTAGEGGTLGNFQRGSLAKVLEDAAFALESGQFTAPIRTRQGFVIFKAVQHVKGGPPEFKEVQEQVEEAMFMARMEPAMREVLTKMREDAYIEIKPGYADSGASPHQVKPTYSAYVPPSPKKKKVERTRFRETTRTFRKKTRAAESEPAVATNTKGASAATTAPVAASATAPVAASATAPVAASATAPVSAKTKAKGKGKRKNEPGEVSMKPGKREKIRLGQAPTKTLPAAAEAPKIEDAGAVSPATQPQQTAQVEEPANPLESAAPQHKTRFADRARQAKVAKVKKTKEQKAAAAAPSAPDSAEVADRQTQAAPLGLAGDTSKKKKKKQAGGAGEKVRLSDQKKKQADKQADGDQPLGNAPQPAPQPAPQQPASQQPAAPKP